MKIAIRIIVLILVVAGAGAGGYYILKGVKLPTFPEVQDIVPFEVSTNNGGVFDFLKGGDESQITENTDTTSETGNFLEKVSDGAVFSYSAISDDEIYYFTLDGRVFRIAPDGDEVVSERVLTSMNGVWATQSGKRALVSFGDPKNPAWGIFDFLDKAWRPLPPSIKYAAWGGNEDTLFAIEEKDGVKNLVKVNLQKNIPVSSVILSNFRMKDVKFMNGGGDKLFVSEKASSFYKGSVWELNTKTLDWKIVFKEQAGIIFKIFPDLSGGIRFSSPNKFSLVSPSGEIKMDFPIKTLPEKCGGTGNRFYCFAPVNILEGVFLPDDYFKNKVFFLDAFYKIDQKTGESPIVFQSGVDGIPLIDGENLSIVGERVYFVNRYDKRLYRINLTLLPNASTTNE